MHMYQVSKEPQIIRLFVENDKKKYGILRIFATLYAQKQREPRTSELGVIRRSFITDYGSIGTYLSAPKKKL